MNDQNNTLEAVPLSGQITGMIKPSGSVERLGKSEDEGIWFKNHGFMMAK